MALQLFNAFPCFFIVDAIEVDCALQLPVFVKNVGSVSRHCLDPIQRL